MKLLTTFLIISLFTIQLFQADAAFLDAQIPEKETSSIPHFKAFQVLFNLPHVLTGFLDYQDTLHSLVRLYEYFLHEKLLKNLFHDIFRFIDADQSGVVTREEYETALRDADIELATAQRVYALAAIENPSRQLGFGDFEVAMELLLDEAISSVTFAYLRGTPENSANIGINNQRLMTGMKEIFSKLPDHYPQPDEDELIYLFNQFDADNNSLLNPEEFFRVVSVFLRYYKAGITNNAYAKLMRRDNVFTLLWERETAEAAFKVQQLMLQESLGDFFQMAVFEDILNTIAQNIFRLVDENANGVIELNEFKKALALFQAPEREALLLYTTSDIDANGSLDFGEFVHVFEVFVRKGLSKIAYIIFGTNGQVASLENCSKQWRDLAKRFSVDIGLTDEAFKALYDTLDVDHNEMLDISEFTEFTSVMVTSIKKTLRVNADLDISVKVAQNATNESIEEAFQNKVRSSEYNLDVGASQAILARLLGRASVETSVFSSTAQDNGANDAGNINLIAKSGSEATESDLESFDALDSGHAPGIGLGFSLYDAVRQATQTNFMDQMAQVESNDPLSPLGLKVFLEGRLDNLAKFDKRHLV